MARSLSNYNFKKLACLPRLNRESDLFLSKIRVAAEYIPDMQILTKGYLCKYHILLEPNQR